MTGDMLVDTKRQSAAMKAVGSGELSLTEEIILKWQWGLGGDFYTALMNAICRADEENLDRIARGHGNEVVAYRAWKTTWIGESLRERGLL